jgi:hypothetical protein
MARQVERLAARDHGAEADQVHPGKATVTSFEETLIEVWRQAFAKNAQTVALGNEGYSIARTSKRRLRQVDFVFDGEKIRGLEQNPDTKSRWAAIARSGKKVMQFLVQGRYVANVADGKVTIYSAGKSKPSKK